jgi:Macrocin-O-methyltransferase (TylF)
MLYLDLMKRVLTNMIYEDPPVPNGWVRETGYDEMNRRLGLDWPGTAHTMVGRRRLDNVQECAEKVMHDGVPGDFIETGVWRGGTCIFMRALLAAYNVTDRLVWVADSFQGMPASEALSHPADSALQLQAHNDVIAVPLETVQRNFELYNLRDDQVRFLPGWFSDTLPSADIERLAIVRLDSDLYESTMTTLTHLYPVLSPGGFVIVDDYHLPVCRAAVHDYRDANGVTEPVVDIDGIGAYWRRG